MYIFKGLDAESRKDEEPFSKIQKANEGEGQERTLHKVLILKMSNRQLVIARF